MEGKQVKVRFESEVRCPECRDEEALFEGYWNKEGDNDYFYLVCTKCRTFRRIKTVTRPEVGVAE